MFNLMKPCVNCPFRKGQGERFQLPHARLDEIFHSEAFPCHKTCVYDDEDGNGKSGPKVQQCAGLMAVLWREGIPNTIMQIASRLGYLDLNKLDPYNQAYTSIKEVRAAHRRMKGA